MEEIWKEISGYEGYYKVSNLGNVRSLDRIIIDSNGVSSRKKGKYIAKTDNGSGYKISSLSKDGRKNMYVHRLVAIHFLENKDNHIEVNHIDGNKSNNMVKNLEWCSRSQNIKHAYKMGMQPSLGNKFNAIKVMNNVSGQLFGCIKEAADFYGLKYSLLKQALNRNCVHKNKIFSELIKLEK